MLISPKKRDENGVFLIFYCKKVLKMSDLTKTSRKTIDKGRIFVYYSSITFDKDQTTNKEDIRYEVKKSDERITNRGNDHSFGSIHDRELLRR